MIFQYKQERENKNKKSQIRQRERERHVQRTFEGYLAEQIRCHKQSHEEWVDRCSPSKSKPSAEYARGELEVRCLEVQR